MKKDMFMYSLILNSLDWTDTFENGTTLNSHDCGHPRDSGLVSDSTSPQWGTKENNVLIL